MATAQEAAAIRAAPPAPCRTPLLQPGRRLELRLRVLQRPEDLRLATHELDQREEEALLEAAHLDLAGAERILALLLGQVVALPDALVVDRSEEHTSELQSLMRISYA